MSKFKAVDWADLSWQAGTKGLIWLVVVYLALPPLAGLTQAIAGSFGYLPGITSEFSLQPWHYWISTENILLLLLRSILIALGATVISLFGALLFVAIFHWRLKTSYFLFLGLFVSLSVPHLALAIGLDSAFRDSGLISRLLCSFLACQHPQFGVLDYSPVLNMIFALTVKEMPFLIYVSFIALYNLPVAQTIKTGASLGYSIQQTYWLLIIPRLYRVLRFPLLIVLAYSLSVVEIPMVFADLGSRTAALAIFDLFWHPWDISGYAMGFSGSVMLVFGLVFSVIIWLAGEKLASLWFHYRLPTVKRKAAARFVFTKVQFGGYLILGWIIPLAVIIIWSLAFSWRFPALLPEQWTWQNYRLVAGDLLQAGFITLLIAAATGFIGTSLAILVSEVEFDAKWLNPRISSANIAIYGLKLLAFLPLVLPQLSFLFGFQLLLENLQLSGKLPAIIWVHSLFCFSYAYFILKDQQQKIDHRYLLIGHSLGLSKLAVLFKIKLPLLAAAIRMSLAVCFSVSVSLYLPTIFTSGGRYPTLMSESMALLSSFTPRVSAPFAVLLVVLPLVFFLLLKPRWQR